jgi:flagellin
MPLNVISNFAANVAHRNLAMSDSEATKSLSKLSAGTRVLTAKDDAASMAVGSRLRAEVSALRQASVNAGQAISMLQIADGAMSKTNDILTRMKTLAVQAGSDQLSGTERAMLDTEFQSLIQEIDRIAADTEFNGTKLVNGSIDADVSSATSFDVAAGVEEISAVGIAAGTFSLSYTDTSQTFVLTNGTTVYSGTIASDKLTATDGTGVLTSSTVVKLSTTDATDGFVNLSLNTSFAADTAVAAASAEDVVFSGTTTTSLTFKIGTGTNASEDEISVTVNSVSASGLGLSGTANLNTKNAADSALESLNNAIDQLQTNRATVGASQNRLEFAADNIAVATENTEAARSSLLDLDVASEMSNFTSKQILVQAGVSMLAQANQLPQNLLQLFQ